MIKILFIFLLVFIKSEDSSETINEHTHDPNLSKIYSIKYFQISKFTFSKNENENDLLQVNIHSINCNIEIKSDVKIINKINLNTYSILINPKNETIDIEPIFDVIYGEYRLNYENKTCYLSLNSYFLNDLNPNIQLDNNEKNIFYFDGKDNDLLNISYKINNINNNNNFVSLNFMLEDSSFLIDVSYSNFGVNPISKLINNSANIYLNSSFLTKNNKSKEAISENGVLKIKITNNKKEKPSLIYFKVIEMNTVSLLEKNDLNFGFLTTQTTNQYYYTEVFKGEEGELMLHNKRFYGELYGKIIEKNEQDLTDISIYPNTSSEEPLLEYNQHYLKLKYNYTDTLNCFNGCYLLITYEQNKSAPYEDNEYATGYEFTILSRSWNYTDYITKIIDIPFNEFIIGCFEQDTTQNHYYSINIPNDTDKIIIEIESNYLEFYYEEGRKKINTKNPSNNTKQLNINDNNNQNVFLLYNKELKFAGKTISFALSPNNNHNNIFSFYYFRVLYFKEEEQIFYPIDSYLGNLCNPEFDKDNNKYYCNFIMKFNYGESKLKFSISSTNQYEYFNISASKNDTDVAANSSEFIYLNKNSENIDYLIIKFEFKNNKIKKIISAFEDKMEIVYPQIYSAQMFYINDLKKKFLFKVKNNYDLVYQYLYGILANITFLDLELPIRANRNFIGRPFLIHIYDKFDNITISTYQEYISYYKLIYNDKSKGIEEVKLGEPKSLVIKDAYFPLYFYIKFTEEHDSNIIFNIRLKTEIDSDIEDDIEIKGYLLKEDEMQRKINGEYIQLSNPIEGYYSNGYNIGFLQAYRSISDNYSYLFIEINKKGKAQINSNLMVDVSAKEYNNEDLWLPINRYIYETFNVSKNEIRRSNRYHINVNRIEKSQVIIEISSQNNDIELEFDNNINMTYYISTGFKKYRIWETDNNNIYFNVTNKKEINANYMIRYYYTILKDEYHYSLNENKEFKINSANNETTSFSLIFDKIIINKGENQHDLINNSEIYFYITGILYKKDETLNENINTTGMIIKHEELQKSVIKINMTDEKWNLTFNNYSNNNNYECELQIQVNVIISKSLTNEEFLVYTTQVDLTNLKESKLSPGQIWGIVGGILGGIVLFLAIFFIVKYFKLKKNTNNLQKEVKAIEFSNDVQKNILIKEKAISKKQSDYETTFI